MRLNFKKVSAIAASALMVGMTMGVAAAANYPNPFVVSGAADVAIVYGTGSGVSTLDLVQAGNIQSNLQSYMAGGVSTGGSATINGESVALFGSSKIYTNSSLNAVTSTVTKNSPGTGLPTILADQSFSGNVDATLTQTIQLGSTQTKFTYKAQPLSTDDPQYGLAYGTGTSAPLINVTATFNKAVNFTHADSMGQTLKLFGTDFTVSSSTTRTDLVLLKSASKIDLTRDVSGASAANPDAKTDVTVGGNKYTIELVSGSDTSSTIKVTDSTGASSTQTVSEAASKKIQGLTVAIVTATSAGNIVSSSIVAGSDKVTFEDSAAVMMGDSNTVMQGTKVSFAGGGANNLTTLVVSFAAPDSDHDAIVAGSSWIDPLFGAIKVDFPSVNYPESSTGRETINITNNGDDMMQVFFNEHRNNDLNVNFIKKTYSMATGAATGVGGLMVDGDYHNMTVLERGAIRDGGYVVVGNQDKGYMLKLSSTMNSSSEESATFIDVATGNTIKSSTSTTGTPTLTLTMPNGDTYTVTIAGDSGNTSTGARYVRLSYPDGSRTTAGTAVIYPTIQSSKGAKVMFYQPQIINLTNWDGSEDVALDTVFVSMNAGANLTVLKIPNGNGYGSVNFAPENSSLSSVNITGGSGATVQAAATAGSTAATCMLNVSSALTASESGCLVSVGKLLWNITNVAGVGNATKVFLVRPGSTTNIKTPALVMFEEKDANNEYQAQVMTFTNGSTYTNVDDTYDTWTNASSTWHGLSVHSNTKLAKSADLWGTLVTKDTSDSNHAVAKISYPDDQLYANLYVGSISSSVTGGTAGITTATQLGEILVKDSEASAVGSKNLIVIGGSCINSVAASLLGSTCGSSFTDKTGVGSGQFLIQSLASTYSTSKVALVVAGYEAADTVNAATYLRNQVVDTTAGKKYKGTSATAAELQVA
jgi:hypothetical protein